MAKVHLPFDNIDVQIKDSTTYLLKIGKTKKNLVQTSLSLSFQLFRTLGSWGEEGDIFSIIYFGKKGKSLEEEYFKGKES